MAPPYNQGTRPDVCNERDPFYIFARLNPVPAKKGPVFA